MESPDRETWEVVKALIIAASLPAAFPARPGNLLFIAHWDFASHRWPVHNVSGDFEPEGLESLRSQYVRTLISKEQGRTYDFRMRRNRMVNLREGELLDWRLNADTSFIVRSEFRETYDHQ